MTSSPGLHAQSTSHRRVQTQSEADRFWNLILAELKLQMTRYTFATWLQQTRAIRLTSTDLTVQVPDSTVKAWLENRLNHTIQRTIAYHTGKTVNIRYVCADDN